MTSANLWYRLTVKSDDSTPILVFGQFLFWLFIMWLWAPVIAGYSSLNKYKSNWKAVFKEYLCFETNLLGNFFTGWFNLSNIFSLRRFYRCYLWFFKVFLLFYFISILHGHLYINIDDYLINILRVSLLIHSFHIRKYLSVELSVS